MKVGANWRSGVDLSALGKLSKEAIDIDINRDFKYRFDNEGLLAVRGVPGKATTENISAIKLSAEHGFLYVASKELFFYSDKKSILLDPVITKEVPEYIKVALGYSSGIQEDTYTTYTFSGIPTFLTPLVIDRLTAKNMETPLIIKNTQKLDDIDKNTITKLENRLTGLEEPIVEVFEVDSIKTINGTTNDIIDPSLYIYNPFDGVIYSKGEYGTISVEFESSFDKRVELGKKFSPSRTGKEKGMLSLSPNLVKTRGSQVSTVSRRVLERQGSTIYINQESQDSVRILVETRYQDEDGNYFEYETLENNLEYAAIQAAVWNKDIYINSVRIGRFNSSGYAIVPIVGYAEDSIHSSFIVTGSEKINVNLTNSGIINGTLRVKIYDIESETIIATEDFTINKQLQKVLVANPELTTKYVPTGDEYCILTKVVNLDRIYLLKLRDSYNINASQILPNKISLDGAYSIRIDFQSQAEAVLAFHEVIPFRIVPATGGGTYGV
jgi:hypothetical protein